jgi:perosamine synthetase
MRIHVARPDLRGNEEKYVIAAIRSSWISSSGEFLDRFEREFAEICGTQAALSVCNGTIALHLALLALDVRPGDEVLVPSLSYIATANAVRYVGAEPVFVDVDPDTWCISPSLLEASITRRTKGIIPVHLYGHPSDMDAINHIAAIHGLWVVEDAAEAHFATYKGKAVGGLGSRMSTFSFYGNKILTCGEGGAVLVSDPQLEVRLRTLRGQGMDPSRRYYHPVTGYNFRLTNVACAILCAQLERRDDIVSARKKLRNHYKTHLPHDVLPSPEAPWADVAPWLMCATFPDEGTRQHAAECLQAAEIETRPFFVPLHELPPFREGSRKRNEHLPETTRLSRVGLCLPLYPELAEHEVEEICEIILQSL